MTMTTTTVKTLANQFGKYSLITGIILLVIGIAGIVLPEFLSLQIAVLMAIFMIFAGFFWASHTYKYSRHSLINWLKPILLLVAGGLMLYTPLVSIAILGLLMSFYLFIDAFGSFTMAQVLHPQKGWRWMTFNGFVSLLLAILFLTGWPTSSMWLVGFYIAISLIFDGLALISIGLHYKKQG